MPVWKVEVTDEAESDLDRLDRPIRERIIDKLDWLEEHFEEITPSPLTGAWRGFFKERVGDWRIAYDFDFSACLITVYAVDRRDRIYKRHPPALP
jgi:mRNA interferase RelE/StbE